MRRKTVDRLLRKRDILLTQEEYDRLLAAVHHHYPVMDIESVKALDTLKSGAAYLLSFSRITRGDS